MPLKTVMRKYYFYTISGQYRSINNLYDFNPYEREFEILKEGLKKGGFSILDTHCLNLIKEQKEYSRRNTKKFELKNGIDCRYLKHTGFKEVSKDSYFEIVEDEKRIVSSFTDKDIKLLSEFKLPTDSWHKPFIVVAANKHTIKNRLKYRAKQLTYMDEDRFDVFLT